MWEKNITVEYHSPLFSFTFLDCEGNTLFRVFRSL